MKDPNMQVIIISGRSGAGKSVALHALEDLGYYCVDNLPINLLPQLTEILAATQKSTAISLDIRNLPQTREILDKTLEQLRRDYQAKLIFLDAQPRILIRRYSDSRRLHPLSHQDLSLQSAIEIEYEYLEPLAQKADLIIDSSYLSNHELTNRLSSFLQGNIKKELKIIIESFGFKYGIPLDADYVFDARFLPNPHWQPELRAQTGLDDAVAEFLAQYDEVHNFIKLTCNYIETWLPQLEQNNRNYLTIAVGCTGGKHRSVYIAEQIAQYFQTKNKNVQVQHKSLCHYSNTQNITHSFS